jgi:CHAD domain-containing protein
MSPDTNQDDALSELPLSAAPMSAGDVLQNHLSKLRDELRTSDGQVRRFAPDSVHQMRIASRKLRSAFATFRPLLVPESSEPVRFEMGWLGGLLGLARDAEVKRQRLAELVANESAELVIGPVAERLDAHFAVIYRNAHHQVLVALNSERYLNLLEALDILVGDLPLKSAAADPAEEAIPKLVRRDWKRLSRVFATVQHAAPGPRRDMLLHETRKAAKRCRYSAEALAPVVGRRAEKFARAVKKLQTILGEHHDSVEFRAMLLQVAAEVHLDGQDSFTYGRLHAIEQARAEGIEEQLSTTWSRIVARHRHWMR